MSKLTSIATVVLSSFILFGCAAPDHDITKVDVSGKNKQCVRECSTDYGRCMQFAGPTSCSNAYKVCSGACP